MPISASYKTVNIKPVTGPLNMRSEPDQVPFGGFRRRINWEITDSGKPGRVRGFQKLLASVSPYNNQDLHDQLCGDPTGTLDKQEYYSDLTVPDVRSPTVTQYPPPSDICGTTKWTRNLKPADGNANTRGRQPITMLDELVSADGQRKLMAGTQNRLYVLEESLGNWKIIADAYGGTPESGLPERRWKRPAQVGNVAILTNGFDPVFYYEFDGVTSGCAMQAIQEIPDASVIGMTRVGCVYAWRGVVFFGDVTLEGVRYQDMVYWSDKDAPLSLDTAADGTIAGFQRLDYGERVLGFVALHNYLLVCTTRGIWQVTVVTDTSSADAPVFHFQKLYSEMASGEACIVYPNTLCTDGDSIFYLGRNDLFRFNLYMSVPERTDWVYAATSLIFDGIKGTVNPINESVCEGHIAWYDPRSQSVYVSWVPTGSTFPSRTLQLNTRDHFASELDFGVTAASPFTPGTSKTFRQWLLDMCGCTESELQSAEILKLLPAPIKTGGYCTQPTNTVCTSLSRTAPIYTSKILNEDGVLKEDYTQPTADAGSFCKQFGNLTINDLCQLCKNEKLLVVAHATDLCLKQIGPEIYVREINTDQQACGKWKDTGYQDKLIFGPFDLEMPDEEKNIRKLELEFATNIQPIPAQLQLRIGYAPNALDPNSATDNCAIIWRTLSKKDLACPSDNSEAGHLTARTSPNRTLHWDFWYTGRQLYVELSSNGTDNEGKGGGYNVSRIGMEVRALPRSTTS